MQKRVKLPNGYTVDLEVIWHPGAALVIPFLNRDTIIFLRQFRPVINKYLYELPAGTLKEGEGPLTCARREIIEETGYSAKKFTFLGKIYPVPGYSTEEINIYKASDLKKEHPLPEQDEIITSMALKKSEVMRLFKRGRITDAKTICALAMCGMYTADIREG